jgi:hypothetical protein
MYRLLRISLGCLLVLLGVIGLFVPVLQGFLFLGIGGLLLCRDVPFLHPAPEDPLSFARARDRAREGNSAAAPLKAADSWRAFSY